MSQTSCVIKMLKLNFQKLESLGDDGLLLLQLMWACNDIAVANRCLGLVKNGKLFEPHQKLGGGLYFVRLQSAHIHEAMKLVEEIREAPSLQKRVKKCSPLAQKAFTNLEKYFSDDPVHKKQKEYLQKKRNNIVFHYQNSSKKKLIDNAIKKRAANPVGRFAMIADSIDVRLAGFEAADRLLQTIICREIYKIEDIDAGPRADEISDYQAELCHAFLMFASDFVIRYLQEEGVVQEQ